jgi:hypothetical protein
MLLLLFALPQQTSDIARLGNLGEINLRLDLGSSRGLFLGGCGGLGKMLPYFFRFIIFKRARVRLLFCDADFGQHVQNRFAFYLKLSGQIIDSSFHPLCVSSRISSYAIISTSQRYDDAL